MSKITQKNFSEKKVSGEIKNFGASDFEQIQFKGFLIL